MRQVKAALGVSGVSAEAGCWRHAADEICPKAVQIDLVLDRDDRVVNLCELKYQERNMYAKEFQHEIVLNDLFVP